MAFTIRVADHDEAYKVIQAIQGFINRSRFTLNLQRGQGGKYGGISVERKGKCLLVAIRGIRLKAKKDYCGNHAGPCRLTFSQHKRHTFLEGLDWVSWNDMLNDALDSIGHNGDTASTSCIIRKGRCRRMDYFGKDAGEFFKDSNNYENHCNRSPVQSSYQAGTPGIFGWLEEELQAAAS
jgi:hypothetical protein